MISNITSIPHYHHQHYAQRLTAFQPSMTRLRSTFWQIVAPAPGSANKGPSKIMSMLIPGGYIPNWTHKQNNVRWHNNILATPGSSETSDFVGGSGTVDLVTWARHLRGRQLQILHKRLIFWNIDGSWWLAWSPHTHNRHWGVGDQSLHPSQKRAKQSNYTAPVQWGENGHEQSYMRSDVGLGEAQLITWIRRLGPGGCGHIIGAHRKTLRGDDTL